MRCVRPDLTTSSNSLDFASSEVASWSSAGSRSFVSSPSVARCTADGKTSFDDCPRFTWSFGWTPSPASEAITSFAFMFVEVPEPVWKTSIGNWSSNSPAAIRSPAAAMRSASSPSSSPRSAFTRAAAALIRPSQRTTGTGIVSPETGKFSTAFTVSPPQSSLGAVSLTWSSVSARGSPASVERRPGRREPCPPIHFAPPFHGRGGALHPPPNENLARRLAPIWVEFAPISRADRGVDRIGRLDGVDRRAAIDRALADPAARRLGQRVRGSPAEIPAARALTGIDPARGCSRRKRSRLSASQTFDPHRRHHPLFRPRGEGG